MLIVLYSYSYLLSVIRKIHLIQVHIYFLVNAEMAFFVHSIHFE